MHDDVMPATVRSYDALSSALAGRYRIERELGHGGMATVYLAQDLKHDRKVALKVLKPDLAAVIGAERFLIEIKTTANLQHPHILALFDSGQVDGTVFYAMPFVEGESLRERLAREKQLPVDTALRIATEIADALHYAHGHGVVHRDIKPENILVHGGHALVADFGISLAASNTAGSRLTETGMSLGTPMYMSPEQAIGDRAIDGRSDIYSLAAVLYEMLAGDPPYVAGTAQAIIAKVLTEKAPSARAARASVPAHVDAAIARALEKLPADRFATALDLSEALAGRGASSASTTAANTPITRAQSKSQRAWPAIAAAFGVVAVVAIWVAVRESRADRGAAGVTSDAPVVRAILDMPAGQRIQDALPGSPVAVSPKGDVIAYTIIGGGGFQTFIRRLNELVPRSVLDVDNVMVAGRNLAFSPDGRWLAFTEGNALKKVAVDGGQVVNLKALTVAVPYGVAWIGNDTILVGSFTGMEAVAANGGNSTMIGLKDSSSVRVGQRWPMPLPGNRYVAFATGNTSSDIARLGILDLRTKVVVTRDIQSAAPLGFVDGHLVFIASSGAVTAISFDLQSLRPSGEPVPLEDGVVIDPTGGAKASLSASGTLFYLKGRAEYQPVLVKNGSVPTPLLRELHVYSTPRFSPDGNRVAISVVTPRSSDIWIYDIQRNTFTRLTSDGSNVRPEWTPDGKRVIFRSERAGKVGIWWQPADGSGPAELLYDPPVEAFEAIMSPDSKWLVFRTAPGSTYSRDILAVRLDSGDRKPVPLVSGPASEQMPRISPDGKWLAYQSNDGGRFEIYVRPFPGTGARTQVSSDGATEPIWNRSGTSLFYRDAIGQFTEVKVTTGASFSIGQRTVVVTGEYLADASHANYDVAPDGSLLLLKRAGAESQTIIVHNWIRELREKTRSSAARR
jgi:serine/threonine-protein kinase